jgi:hypothetical protein
LVRVRLRDVGVAEQALLADRLQKMQLNGDQRRFQIAGLAEGLTAGVSRARAGRGLPRRAKSTQAVSGSRPFDSNYGCSRELSND